MANFEWIVEIMKGWGVPITHKTKLMHVPPGTREWVIAIPPKFSLADNPEGYRTSDVFIDKRHVRLLPISGIMVVGYDRELDILLLGEG